MIQTYFGYGKGKTTAAIGSAIRCAGCGKNVLFAQFLKNNASSECVVLKNISSIDILCSDINYNLFDNAKTELAPILSDAYSNLLSKVLNFASDRYQMIILDEILDAVEYGYISLDSLVECINKWSDSAEVILTGHNICDRIKQISDYISEVVAVKHPYTKGILARKGIEY